MSDEKPTKPGRVQLKNVRLSFSNLFEPTASVADGPLKYGANFIMDPGTPEGKANIKACERAIAAVKKDHWKEKADKIEFEAKRFALLDGNKQKSQQTLEVYDGYEGMMAVSAKNKKRPSLFNRDGSQATESDNPFFDGCRVYAIVEFYPVSGKDKGGNGIFASLEGVRFFKDDEPFGAAPIDADEFDDFEDEFGDDDDDDLDI